jgi:hypothetical protein
MASLVPIGIVIGSTTPNEFQFVAYKMKNGRPIPLRRGQFIKIASSNDSNNFLLGRIIAVVRQNELLSESMPSHLSLLTSNGDVTLEDIGFRKDITESLIATVEVLGSRMKNEKNVFNRPRTPVFPGEKVFEADTDFLNSQLTNENDYNLCLGFLRDDIQVPINIDMVELVSKHFAVLAMTGAGKSYTVGVLIEEMFSVIDLPIILFDPHGEFYSLAIKKDNEKRLSDISNNGYPSYILERIKNGTQKIQNNIRFYSTDPIKSEKILDKIKKKFPELDIKINPLKIQLADLDASQLNMLLTSFYSITEPQMRIIDAIWSKIHYIALNGDYVSFDTIKEEIEKASNFVRGNSPIDLLIGKLTLLNNRSFFVKNPQEKRIGASDLVQKGHISIIDLSLTPLLEQQAIAAILGKKILNSRIEGTIPPVLLMFEEAHKFAPGSNEASVSLTTMKQIAQEGRKFFVGLGLVSQRPSRLDSDVLSQCNNQIIMRLTNPNDQNYVKNISEWMTKEDIDEIRSLSPGEAYLFGPATIMSLPIKVRPRGTYHGGITPDLKDELSLF